MITSGKRPTPSSCMYQDQICCVPDKDHVLYIKKILCVKTFESCLYLHKVKVKNCPRKWTKVNFSGFRQQTLQFQLSFYCFHGRQHPYMIHTFIIMAVNKIWEVCGFCVKTPQYQNKVVKVSLLINCGLAHYSWLGFSWIWSSGSWSRRGFLSRFRSSSTWKSHKHIQYLLSLPKGGENEMSESCWNNSEVCVNKTKIVPLLFSCCFQHKHLSHLQTFSPERWNKYPVYACWNLN